MDNTFLTPTVQRPIEFGADFVVRSTTKVLNGHSDVVGGAVVSADVSDAQVLADWANTDVVESLIAHPESMTHASMTPQARAAAGIGANLLRLSVGLEGEGDLRGDLDRALKAIAIV